MKTHYKTFKNNTRKITGIILISLMYLQACVEDPEMKRTFAETEKPMIDVIRSDTSLTLAIQALEKTNLSNTLNTYGPFTFFAPNNQAFKRYFIKKGIMGLDQIDAEDLRVILQYHILNTRRRAKDFVQGTLPDSTVNGDYFRLNTNAGIISGTIINETANVYETDIEGSNGVVHKINAVIDPPVSTIAGYLERNPNLSILAAGMERAGLMDTLSTLRSINSRRVYTIKTPFKLKTQLTLLAETNDVMEAGGITLQKINTMPLSELTRLMRYHILTGNQYTHSLVSTTDYKNLGLPGSGFLDAVNLQTLSTNDFVNYDKTKTGKINSAINIKPNGKDIFVRNGVVQLIDKALTIVDIGTVRRIPIIHEVESHWYAFGAPVNSNSPRVFGPEKASNDRPAEYFAFMLGDSKDDSLVTIIPGIQKGKYKITMSYKKGGNRDEVQPVLGGKTTGLSKVNMRNGNNYEQNSVISNSYEFKTSGTKRLAFRTTGSSSKYEIGIDVVVLTPLP